MKFCNKCKYYEKISNTEMDCICPNMNEDIEYHFFQQTHKCPEWTLKDFK